jgi:glycosyltransferase 2 family protein
MPVNKIYRIIGNFLIFTAICYLSYKLWQIKDVIKEWRFNNRLFIVIFLSSTVYAFICFFLSFAWSWLLIFFSQKRVSIRDCISIYAKTLIARYIPGNVFHIAGRYVAGRNLGIDHASLAGATLYEIIGILISSSALALLGQAIFNVNQHLIYFTVAGIIFVVLAVFPFVFNKVTYHHSGFLKNFNVDNRGTLETAKGLLPVFLLYFLFFVILSIIFLYLVFTVSGLSNISYLGKIISVFALSIVAGFLTPGAPGGLGVREAIIVGFMTQYIGESQSIFIALLFRIVTFSGDYLFFLSSFLTSRKTSENKKGSFNYEY